MTTWIAMRLAIMFCLFGGVIAVCEAQAPYTPPPPQLTTLPPCPAGQPAKKTKKKDCDPTNIPGAPDAEKPAAPTVGSDVTRKFPYPGEELAKPSDTPAAKAFPYPGEKQDAPAKSSETPAAKAFPYPGDPAPASPEPAGAAAPAATDSSSSSSSSSDDASSKDDDDDHDDMPKLTDKGSEGKRNKKTIKPQTDTERVDEDLNVAKFYGQSGNSMGAYLRAKDAVKTQPDYPEAHFVLGEAARRLNKHDEAKAEFSEYLKLAPDGVRAKAAEKAIAELP